jgi:hypothetical protein
LIHVFLILLLRELLHNALAGQVLVGKICNLVSRRGGATGTTCCPKVPKVETNHIAPKAPKLSLPCWATLEATSLTSRVHTPETSPSPSLCTLTTDAVGLRHGVRSALTQGPQKSRRLQCCDPPALPHARATQKIWHQRGRLPLC